MVVGFGLIAAGCAIEPKPFVINNYRLFEGPIIELILLSIVLWIGRIRGWSLATFGFKISWKSTAGGLLLFVIAEVVLWGVWTCTEAIHVQPLRVIFDGTAPFILFCSVINAVFEEVLEAGYLISALSRFGMWPAILAGAIFRACYHLFIGLNTAMGLFAFGLVFGWVYWRWRQLWPLVIAHALADFFGMFYLSHEWQQHIIHHAA